VYRAECEEMGMGVFWFGVWEGFEEISLLRVRWLIDEFERLSYIMQFWHFVMSCEYRVCVLVTLLVPPAGTYSSGIYTNFPCIIYDKRRLG
jgi:hypothetical protein